MGMRLAFALGVAQLVAILAVDRLFGFAGLPFDLAALGELGRLLVVLFRRRLVAFALVALTHGEPPIMIVRPVDGNRPAALKINVGFPDSFRQSAGRMTP